MLVILIIIRYYDNHEQQVKSEEILVKSLN